MAKRNINNYCTKVCWAKDQGTGHTHDVAAQPHHPCTDVATHNNLTQLPWRIWSDPLRVKAQDQSEFSELDATEWLGEDVGKILVSGHMWDHAWWSSVRLVHGSNGKRGGRISSYFDLRGACLATWRADLLLTRRSDGYEMSWLSSSKRYLIQMILQPTFDTVVYSDSVLDMCGWRWLPHWMAPPPTHRVKSPVGRVLLGFPLRSASVTCWFL